jgi:ankyrin repeat protein
MLNYLLQKQVDVDYRGALSTTALAVSADLDRIDLMKKLIEAGADINVRGVSGKPLLIESVKEGNREKFDLLMAKGADVNLKTGETIGSEMNALSFAIGSGNSKMTDVLLLKGAKSDVYGISGQPLVHEVVAEQKREVVLNYLRRAPCLMW